MFPARLSMPNAGVPPGETVVCEAIDWIAANASARAVAAGVPHCWFGQWAPSDHWPVHAVYEL